MRDFLNVSLLAAAFLLMNTTLRAAENLAVPGQVQFAGRIEGLNLTAEGAEATEVKAGVRGVTFSLFAEHQGGAALWVESQNVSVSGDGVYSTLLGAETAGGIPQSIFASGEARWLEVSYTGADGVQLTQPRVLLVSVPYALKAGDAATLGGLPASAFVLHPDAVASRVSDNGGLPGATITDVLPSAAVTAGRIAKFNSALATDVVDSIITESSGKIGIGTTTPVGTIDVGGWASIPGDIQGVGSTISGDVFMGNTNGGIGRFRMASNALQGFFSWNQYFNGTNHKGMDATAPGWRVNIGGTGAEDAYYVERSPATAGGHVPVRLFVVNGNGNVGVNTGTAAPLGTLDVGGWPAIPNDIQGVGSNISGDVFMGNTNGGIGRYRMASNAAQGFFSWNQYYNGVGHKGMDATAPGWRINVGGTGVEDAFYVERSPATANLHVPARLFQVSGDGNVGISTTAPTAKLDVIGTVKATGFTLTGNGAAAGRVLTSDASGNASWTAAGSGTISGSGTLNKLPKFTPNGTTLGDSLITDDGTNVTISVNSGGLAVLGNATSPNIRAGFSGNSITVGVVGATISGGGENGVTNRVTDNLGTVGGGQNNQAGDNAGSTADRLFATVAGGSSNTASAQAATVGGGAGNTASAQAATVGGGFSNLVTDEFGTVAGGNNNQAGDNAGTTADRPNATVAGGKDNIASGTESTVGGGDTNTASGLNSTVGGGFSNAASGSQSTVAGGGVNTASASGSTVGGGNSNSASAQNATVGGGGVNTASGPNGTVGGGDSNLVTDFNGTVAGGQNNQAGDNAGTAADRTNATVGGGNTNTASGSASTVAGGNANTASGLNSTVGGGNANAASANNSTVGGGFSNNVIGASSVIAGGNTNLVSGSFTSIGGGFSNLVTDDNGTIAGGNNNQAGDNAGSAVDRVGATVGGGEDNIASGTYSTVPGGTDNVASGPNSFAAGTHARAINTGSFVWADSSSGSVVNSQGAHSVTMRANGGYFFYTDATATAGAQLTGTAWTAISDRNAKRNFADVDGPRLLEKLNAIPMQTWNYKAVEQDVLHMGPMAQDFYAAFGLGGDDKRISTIDADGVALAGVQALYRQMNEKLAEKDTEIAELKARLAQIESVIDQRLGVQVSKAAVSGQ